MNNEELNVALESIPTPEIEKITEIPKIHIDDLYDNWIPDMNGIFHAQNMEALVHVFPKLGNSMAASMTRIANHCNYFSQICSASANSGLSSSYANIGMLAESTGKMLVELVFDFSAALKTYLEEDLAIDTEAARKAEEISTRVEEARSKLDAISWK